MVCLFQICGRNYYDSPAISGLGDGELRPWFGRGRRWWRDKGERGGAAAAAPHLPRGLPCGQHGHAEGAHLPRPRASRRSHRPPSYPHQTVSCIAHCPLQHVNHLPLTTATKADNNIRALIRFSLPRPFASSSPSRNLHKISSSIVDCALFSNRIPMWGQYDHVLHFRGY